MVSVTCGMLLQRREEHPNRKELLRGRGGGNDVSL